MLRSGFLRLWFFIGHVLGTDLNHSSLGRVGLQRIQYAKHQSIIRLHVREAVSSCIPRHCMENIPGRGLYSAQKTLPVEKAAYVGVLRCYSPLSACEMREKCPSKLLRHPCSRVCVSGHCVKLLPQSKPWLLLRNFI